MVNTILAYLKLVWHALISPSLLCYAKDVESLKSIHELIMSDLSNACFRAVEKADLNMAFKQYDHEKKLEFAQEWAERFYPDMTPKDLWKRNFLIEYHVGKRHGKIA